jgi:hypothetical protein
MQSPKFSNFTGTIVREAAHEPLGEATINVEQLTNNLLFSSSGGLYMKKTVIAVFLCLLITGFATFAHAELGIFLARLNDQAADDMPRYNARLSNQFGIPLARVQVIVRTVGSPADAFMCLQLGRMTGRPFETVYPAYNNNRGKGWGVIAKELGIKPGSPEFHALKSGDFVFAGEPGGKGYGKDKGKGHNK